MREEGFMSGSDDVRLTVEIVVASSQVGRIIGKGGQNVRELQRVTGSLIKLPEQPQQQGQPPQDHDTTVHIVGLLLQRTGTWSPTCTSAAQRCAVCAI